MKPLRTPSFLLLMAIFALPISQQLFSWVRLDRLHGAVSYASDTVFTWKGWWDESYQKKKEAWVNDSFGFRPEFVRLHNQLRYSLYGLPGARGVVIGREGYLYEENYIRAVTGTDLLDTAELNSRCEKIARAARLLQAEDVLLLVILAPGKGSYLPEYIPEKYGPPATVTNYVRWRDGLIGRGIPVLDFNAWFRGMKDTTRYPLYPKTGIHWSQYGVTLAVDSTVRYLEQELRLDLPDLRWENIELTTSARDDDKDIEDGMNLLFPLDRLTMAYPELIITGNGKQKVPVLTIADSYYWQWFGSGIAERFFEPAEFWYYFEEAHVAASGQPPKPVSELNLTEKLLAQRVIILLSTDANLSRFDYGFSEQAIAALTHPKRADEAEARIRRQEADIRNTPDWYRQVIEKAKARGIPVDSMLRLDALWVVEQKANR